MLIFEVPTANQHSSFIIFHSSLFSATSWHDGGISAALRHTSFIIFHSSLFPLHHGILAESPLRFNILHSSFFTLHFFPLHHGMMAGSPLRFNILHSSFFTLHFFPLHHGMMAGSPLRFNILYSSFFTLHFLPSPPRSPKLFSAKATQPAHSSLSRDLKCIASAKCGISISLLPARSAIVLDTFRIRSYALADNCSFFMAVFNSAEPAASI